ncbi:hypothetical protein FACS1894158_04320 [Betaproteobacteria bacterium]|nr:hypothetical protein FACS1894158_04320 [Betaproteobacteria bacterium]
MENKKIELPLFGRIEPENADWEYKYESHIYAYDFDGLKIDLDVHFKKVNSQTVESVSQALTDLKKINETGTTAYLQDFEEEGEAKEYVGEWAQDIFQQIFTEEEFSDFLQHTDKEKPIEEQLLSLIRLVRVGVYAESDDDFVTLDYAFGYELDKGFRDNMIVVKLNQDYEVTEITMEG